MEHLANKFTEKLVKWQIVKNEDKELYAYGFWQGAVLIFNLSTIVIVGLLFQMLWHSFVFMISYGLLRPIAGGYHARTQRHCYVLSVGLIVIVLCALKWLQWNTLICLTVLIVSICSVFYLAPVEDQNKPLDHLEQRIYKKRSRITALFLALLAIIFICLNHIWLASCVAIAILATATMLILGKIKNITLQD